jgi:hypothetical protein
VSTRPLPVLPPVRRLCETWESTLRAWRDGWEVDGDGWLGGRADGFGDESGALTLFLAVYFAMGRVIRAQRRSHPIVRRCCC